MVGLLDAAQDTITGPRREGAGRGTRIALYLALHLAALWACLFISFSAAETALALVLLFARGVCVSAGYHRLLAHRSYKTSRLFQFLLAAGGCSALRGGPLWWVARHRHHHRWSDTDRDVISPNRGFWWSYAGWLLSGKHDATDYSLVADLARFPELVWLNRHWHWPGLLLGALVWLLFGLDGFLAGFCLSSVGLLHSMAILDGLNHTLGFRRYDTGDLSRNSFALALFIFGEGWHNNHHHYETSANHGFFWWELDGTYTVLRALCWLGLVWDLRRPPPAALQRNLLRDKHCQPAIIAASATLPKQCPSEPAA